MWVSPQTNSDCQSKCCTKGVSSINGNNWVTDNRERNQNINISFHLTFIIYDWELCAYLTRPLSASNLIFFLYSQLLNPSNFSMSQFCLCELTRNYKVELCLVTFKRECAGSSWGLWPFSILFEWKWCWFVLGRLRYCAHPWRPFPLYIQPDAWRAPWEQACTQWINLSSF